jgi:hypothetical protein
MTTSLPSSPDPQKSTRVAVDEKGVPMLTISMSLSNYDE